MWGKKEQSSEDEVNALIQQFRLDGLTEEEKSMLKTLAENKALVSATSNSVLDMPFRKTLICQNWMILSRLVQISDK